MMSLSDAATEFLAALPPALVARTVPCTEIRKQVRKDLAAATAAGVIPDAAAFSVRGDHNSITVEITAWPGCPLNTAYTEAVIAQASGDTSLMATWDRDHDLDWRGRARRTDRLEVTTAVNDVLALLEVLVNRHNYNNSDTQTDHFDVGYYDSISATSLIDMARQAIAEECTPGLAAKRQAAIEAAGRLGAKATAAICGRAGVKHCNEFSLDQLLKLDATAAGRPVVYDRMRRRWGVDWHAVNASRLGWMSGAV